MSKPNEFSKLQDLLAAGRVVVPGHMSPPERPLAPVDDDRDFSWCAKHRPGECGGHWRWDRRTMFSVRREGGPGLDHTTFQLFVCFNH